MAEVLRRARRAAAVALCALAAAACGGTTTVVPPDTAPTAEAPVRPPADPDPAPAPGDTAPRAQPEPAPEPEPEPEPEPPATTAVPPRAPDDTGGVLVERPTGFPNRGEAFLLERLHPDVARRCTRARADTLAAGAVAGLECDTLAAFGAATYYDLFPTVVLAEGAYGRYRRANGVPLAHGACLARPGTAAAAQFPAEGPWRAGAARGAGRVMCFGAGGRVWLVSSHPAARILTYLNADRRAPLAPFWREYAAPTATPR